MAHALPGKKRLVITWAILMGLTVLSMSGGQVVGEGRGASLAWWSVLLVLGATYYKGRQVLMVYLNLNASTAVWRGTLRFFLLLALGLILAGYGLTELRTG